MADWSQLPKELLQLISERLDDSPLYLIRFRSVCSTWRSSIPKPHYLRHLPSNFPLFPNDDAGNKKYLASTFSLSKRTIFLLTPPPHQQQTLPLRPWLIEIDQDSRGPTQLWPPLAQVIPFQFTSHPPQVLDFNQLHAFDLGHAFCLTYPPLCSSLHPRKVVAATWQGDNEGFGFVLLTILYGGGQRELALFRCGDEQWTIIPDMPMPFDDVCVFKGRPCAVDGIGRTVTVGLDSSVDLVAEPVFGGNEKFLVESEGELLLVDKYTTSFDNYHSGIVYEYEYERWEQAVKFDVYRLEEKEKKWVQLTTFGDRILFLGSNCSFSASASDLCVGKGNCVLFTEGKAFDVEMRVFNLDDGEISPLPYDDPSYGELFGLPPNWLGLHY